MTASYRKIRFEVLYLQVITIKQLATGTFAEVTHPPIKVTFYYLPVNACIPCRISAVS